MKAQYIKDGIGIYAATATIMSIIIPVPVLASIAQAFPDVPMATVQLIVAIPSLLAIVANFITAKLATRYTPRVRTIAACLFYVAAGLVGYFLHDSFPMLIVASCLAGLGMGGVQNSIASLITNSFDGDARGAAFGLCSVFVGLGGFVYVSLAAMLGAEFWYNAYLGYFVVILLIVLQLVFLPKGELEEKTAKGEHVKIPREVIVLCVFGFAYFGATQLFNNNISMFVAETGLGGTIEAGNASQVYTLAGMAGGFIVFPVKRLFKNQTLAFNAIMSVIGCVLIVASGSLLGVCVGAAFVALGFAIYNPIESQLVSEASPAKGLAFNLALMAATQSIGQASSPYWIGAAATPLGGGVTSMFYVGIIIFAALVVAQFLYFNALKKKGSSSSDVAGGAA
ncbi:MFS transporter [Adlercreutzia caecimuris]|uniref:MFS transporter n=1 Tax=Adlercreutzia caecimuris TaxID=671266 RepID=UPI00249443BE|nr:MFS transporter [Adlercreutzia caecimuris]